MALPTRELAIERVHTEWFALTKVFYLSLFIFSVAFICTQSLKFDVLLSEKIHFVGCIHVLCLPNQGIAISKHL